MADRFDVKSRTVPSWLRRGLCFAELGAILDLRLGVAVRNGGQIVYVFGWIVYVFDMTLDLWCGGTVAG